MTFVNFGVSSQSAPWYLIGCAAALPDLLNKCFAITNLNLWLFSIRVPYLLPCSLVVYLACFLLAERREVAIRAAFLGVITGLGIHLLFYANLSSKGFGMYLVFLAWFHFSEYYFTETHNPKAVKLSSFMLNHSPAYNIALACSIIEFLLERYCCPGMKEIPVLMYIGFFLCVFGDFIRKRAMCVAGSNFNHLVQYDLLNKDHSLVTHDVYGIIQHPSYTGWFIFTIGTQVTLCNPVCGLLFPFVMYKFFEERVRHEEPALVAKHGEKYERYRERTSRFIPLLW